MAKTETETPPSADEKPAKSKKKLLMIVGPAMLLLAGGGFFFLKGGSASAAPADTTVPAVVEGEVVEVGTMTVNLVGEDGRYARVGFALVLDATADSAEVGKRIPLLQDSILTIMTGFTSAELQTAAGMERLRTEVSDKAGELFDGDVIRAVLTELIVQ